MAMSASLASCSLAVIPVLLLAVVFMRARLSDSLQQIAAPRDERAAGVLHQYE
jgi:hypothetical protein